ncbi:wolframin isoform X2 [Condylostylus longicornis]|uniref:wolframin isoform X2 n=1 Tax=Condylostylus longicornis TaxID=2530218 RepID=UPI00244E01C9|nr:wolframin isoform X2 [Condylostylus longicornis]
MASWTKKTPTGQTPRRRWNIEDRASLNNLKYHFASDGCSDVQYDLARQLLENSSDLNETTESHIQGVHWLLCAAQQGHEGALELLKDCFKNRRGITDSNESDVKSCLYMTPGERAARKAARDLFACLSNGNEHITPGQLERKMREIYNLQKKRRRSKLNERPLDSVEDETQDELEFKGNAERNIHLNGDIFPSLNHCRVELNISQENLITEANLVAAAVNYSRGYLPRVNGLYTLSIPHPNCLDHIPCFHRMIFHPVIFVTLLYHHFIKTITSFPNNISSGMQILSILFVYAIISTDNLMVYIPMQVYYISLIIMVWSTFKMLKVKHDFIDFRIWSGLFLSYGDNNVDAGGSENQFLKNNLKPYAIFFCAFIINLITFPVVSNEWVPYSEITLVAFILIFVTMTAFMYTAPKGFPDWLIMFSFGINVLAKYPYEMDSVVTIGWRFLDLKVPTFYSFVIGNGIEFCLNCRVLLYLFIPFCLINLAKRLDWQGIYTFLIPHCVTLAWLQICIMSSQSATMFGLMRATLGLAGIMLFLPLFGIITLMIPIFVMIDWLGLTDPKVRMASSVTAVLMATLISCAMAINHRTQKYITILQITLFVGASVLLTLPYMTANFSTTHISENSAFNELYVKNHRSNGLAMNSGYSGFDEELKSLTWEHFYNYCAQPAWEHSNKIKTQLRCSQLEGIHVKWEGIVSDIEIVRISNFRAEFIKKYMPNWIRNFLFCAYGEKNKYHCAENEDCEELRQLLSNQKFCNMNNWNMYEYEIELKMQSGLLSRPTTLYLKVKHHFGNFTNELRISDRIWFSGKLLNIRNGKLMDYPQDMILGSGKPVVEIDGLGCVYCHNKDLTSIELRAKNEVFDARMRDLTRGVKYLLNAIFNPLIIFK